VDWHRGPGAGKKAAAGVAQLLARAQQELGGPLLGARFLYDAREMLAATREIEQAVSAPGTTLYVGFQRADKLDGEARSYRNLTGHGVQVIAFGTGSPAEVPEVRWVRLPEDHGALANQWFLVTQTPEPLAFVGFETSPLDRIGQGGAADPSRTWAGFVTDDPRLVGAIAGHLHGLADRKPPAVPDGQVAAPSTMLLVATDDGTDPAYAVCRRAGLDLARREGAAVMLYDRSSESYLVDPYESGPQTSQNHGPAGDRPLDLPDLLRLGRRYLADQVTEGRALGLQVGAWLARGTGPAAMAAACERLGVDRVVLPDTLARPSLRDRVLGRTLAGFQDRLAAKITLVNDQGALVDA
jgi:Sensory domain in DIguanylate Cyclases and Two-component system